MSKVVHERKQEIHKLYTTIRDKVDKDKEDLYKALKKNFDEDLAVKLIYASFESSLSLILSKIKNYYKTYKKDIIIDLEKIFYNNDNQTLEERIHKWFQLYDKDQLLILFYHLCLILDTETERLIPLVIKAKTDCEYVVIFGNPCDCDGLCAEYCDEEPHLEVDTELPPYHPSCQCEAIFYEKKDIAEDL